MLNPPCEKKQEEGRVCPCGTPGSTPVIREEHHTFYTQHMNCSPLVNLTEPVNFDYLLLMLLYISIPLHFFDSFSYFSDQDLTKHIF